MAEEDIRPPREKGSARDWALPWGTVDWVSWETLRLETVDATDCNTVKTLAVEDLEPESVCSSGTV